MMGQMLMLTLKLPQIHPTCSYTPTLSTMHFESVCCFQGLQEIEESGVDSWSSLEIKNTSVLICISLSNNCDMDSFGSSFKEN